MIKTSQYMKPNNLDSSIFFIYCQELIKKEWIKHMNRKNDHNKSIYEAKFGTF